MRKTKYLIVVYLLSTFGCQSISDEELWLKIEHAKENGNWDSTMTVSQRILNEFPDGRYAGWAQFALAESYRFKNQPREALDQYKIFVEKYPDLKPRAVSLFLVGFIYANNFQMYDSARWYYDDFLKRYPKHDLVPSIQLELQNMGNTPLQPFDEEKLKNFKNK